MAEKGSSSSTGIYKLLVLLFSAAVVAMGSHELHLLYGGDRMSGGRQSDTMLHKLHDDYGVRASIAPEAIRQLKEDPKEEGSSSAEAKGGSRIIRFLDRILP